MAVTARTACRVLYLEHNVDGTVGGSHYCLLDICRLLDRKRFLPIVWFYQSHALLSDFERTGSQVVVERPPAPARFGRGRVPVISGVLRVAQSATNRLRSLTVGVLWWWRRLRKLRPALIHLNNNCSGDVELQLAAYLVGIPVVAHQRGFAGGISGMARAMARRQKAILAISNPVREYLLRAGLAPDRVQVVFDGIDPERLAAVASAGGPVVDRTAGPLIGMVGNVKPWKGQEVLVRAMRIVADQVPSARCWIVGAEVDPAYSRRLRELIGTLNMQEQVALLGFLRDSSRLMQGFDIVVHASIEPEPFGIVLLEAMHHARPVIASAHGGPLDIIVGEETGLLTTPGDPEDLARAILRLLRDPDEAARLGAAGQRRLRELFTAQRTVSRIIEVYDKVLST